MVMSEPSRNDFYARVPVFTRFADVLDAALYEPLPGDWHVGITDDVSSTEAIAAGRYKLVNTVGASIIAAQTNALEGWPFPFVFGGDGASFAIPGAKADLARTALAATAAWAPFDEAALRRLVAEGKTVFVDVTAEWCVNCKANEALVLDRPEVAAALHGPNVVAMRADWTRPDPRISDYLARNNRFGIPFNAVYGPATPRGIALSEVLTREAVLDALRRARGNSGLSSR
jgi:thiol-disulfide isomerase/thioredoxin